MMGGIVSIFKCAICAFMPVPRVFGVADYKSGGFWSHTTPPLSLLGGVHGGGAVRGGVTIYSVSII